MSRADQQAYLDRMNFENDHRTRAARMAEYGVFEVVSADARSTVLAFDADFVESDDALVEHFEAEGCALPEGVEGYGIKVATHNEVCPTCNGTGKHVRPDIDCGGLTAEELREFDDDDGWEGSMAGWEDDESPAPRRTGNSYLDGAFDVTCYQCKGRNVVAVPVLPSWLSEAVEERAEDDASYEAECRMERIMGC